MAKTRAPKKPKPPKQPKLQTREATRFVWLIEDLWKDQQLSHTKIAEELGLTQPWAEQKY